MSQLKVNTIRHTGASSDAVTLASDGSCIVKATNNLWNRNVLINSNFSVNQRGSFNANTGEYTLDMWYHNVSGATSTVTQETQTVGSEIEGQDKYYKQVVATGNNHAGIRYKVEDVKTITPGTWTLSFWAKGTTPPGGLQVAAGQDFGTSGSADVDIASQTATALTGSWVRQSINITVPSFSGKTINAGSWFQFTIGQGSDTGTAAWELNIANIQLEKGSQMTDYEPPRSYADELARCQRYFYKIGDGVNRTGFATVVAHNSGASYGVAHFPVTMRTTPALTKDGANSDYYVTGNSGNQDITGLATEGLNKDGVTYQVSGSFTQGYGYWFNNKTTAGTLSFSAEL